MRHEGGFSLIEILVVLAIASLLAGALAPLTIRQLNSARSQKALDQMRSIVRGMAGDPAGDEFGYVGDLGGLPANLLALNQGTGQAAWVVDPADGVGYGFNGPYVPDLAPAGSPFVDPWNQPYAYVATQAQLTSAGPDRSFGTGDDLVYPPSPRSTSGDLTVTVIGLPSGGGPAEQLDASQVGVWVASSLAGVRNTVQIGGSGPFWATGLHIGLHGVSAVGAGSYAGTLARDVVAVRRGTNAVRIVLEQP